MATMLMAKMLFGTASSVSNGTGAANVLTPDPKEVWAAPGSGNQSVNIDMGAAVTMDTFFVGFIGGTVTSVGLFTATGLGTGTSFVQDLVLGPAGIQRRHAFLKRAAVTSRYWTFSLFGAPSSVGIVAMGSAIQPTWGHEWGSGRQPIDTAQISQLRGGGFAVEPGAVKGSWQFTLGDLTDVDLKALWAMTLDIGIHSPVLAMEDPALTGQDMNDALHYGLLDRPEVYERQYPGSSRWSFRVEEWV
jgi:hypothetical protein